MGRVRDWARLYVCLDKKMLNLMVISKYVTVRTYHKLSSGQYGHIVLAKSCQKLPKKPKLVFHYVWTLMTLEDLGAGLCKKIT